MNEDIFERIENTLVTVNSLDIPVKYKGDQLTAGEFNSVVDKINEIKNHLNGPTKSVITDTTSYILDKINSVKLSLSATEIPMGSDPAVTIANEIQNIKNRLSTTEFRSVENANNISYIQSNLNNISYSLGIVSEKVEELDDMIEQSYTDAVAAANEYTDEKVEEAYTKLDVRVTHINDTTLTFDYDIRTDPEPIGPKIIYDNDKDLYDGEYHD